MTHLTAQQVRSLKLNPQNLTSRDVNDLNRLGIFFDRAVLDEMIQVANKTRSRSVLGAFGMDSVLQPDVTTPSITTPIQFLQNWLPGFVYIITAARKIDELVGISTMGAWEDAEVVQSVLELTGTSVPYGDYNNVPFSSWNANYNRFSVVRFEEGMKVGVLEAKTAARVNIDDGTSKRESAALALEIQRNAVGFYGFNDGNNNTYGFLTDPGLPSYQTAAENAAATSTMWADKSFLEICADIRTMVVRVRTSSQDQIDPETTPMTLALATDVVDYLSTVSDFGISVRDWMTKAYPKIRVVSAPELNLANGGENVGYLYADSVNDSSTDDGKTWMQVVPAKFLTLGVQQLAKAYEEDYSNATAGVFCKRPYAVTRITGI